MYNCTYMANAVKKLTILVESDVYIALHRQVGRGNIGRFLVSSAKPLLEKNTLLKSAYRSMAEDEAREREARAWSESLAADSYVA